MSQSCTDCADKAKEMNREMNGMLLKAKAQAIEEKKPKAICLDQVEGKLFITDARIAIEQRFKIESVLSHL